ncbi:hypothetical protein EK904_000958 [Melospiza melodia maxima]|nr:hypothetical protein EK904_000958 [Melospiza melodia maxima]
MWLQQPRTGRHHRQGLAKKEKMPSRGQLAGEESLRMGSGASAVEELGAEGQPAALKQNKDVFLGFESYPERENQSPGSEKGKKQNREHRRHSRRDRLKHHRGKTAGAGPSSLYKKPKSSEEQFQNLQAEEAPSLTPSPLLTAALDTAVSTEEPPVLPATSPRSQARLRQDGDVMPTLDMALFDWTDYEDLKPEMWPSAKKKGAKPPFLFPKSHPKNAAVRAPTVEMKPQQLKESHAITTLTAPQVSISLAEPFLQTWGV